MKTIMTCRLFGIILAFILLFYIFLQSGCVSQPANVADLPVKASTTTEVATSLAAIGNVLAGARVIPERIIPIPETVSPELQFSMKAPIRTGADKPRYSSMTAEDWEKYIETSNKFYMIVGSSLLKSFPGKYENQTIAGVPVTVFTPDGITQENANRILMYLHPGGFCLNGGVAGIFEAVYMTKYWKIKVIYVDYRMPPDYPFPAALDDAVAVYRDIIKTYKPENVGIFGTSAGGGLTLSTVLKLKELGILLPGAIAPGSPWSDLTKTGDTYYTNEFIDNVLVSYDNFLGAAAVLYAGGHDLKEPLLSPVYGDFKGFPPTILTTGTRDLFLSNTVRVHRLLHKAGVEADLEVFEGMSHAQYDIPGLPESAEAFAEIARFFDKHLGK